MENLIKYLDGKKTFLTVAAGFVVVTLNFFGYLDMSHTQSLLEILGFASVGALRLAVKKV